MDKQQEQFENYLREFEPRRPRPLPAAPDVLKIRRAAAGVAGIALCIGTLWLVSRKPATNLPNAASPAQSLPEQEVSLSRWELTQLALEHPSKFEEALTAASKRILPRFDGDDSTLRVLAKQ